MQAIRNARLRNLGVASEKFFAPPQCGDLSAIPHIAENMRRPLRMIRHQRVFIRLLHASGDAAAFEHELSALELEFERVACIRNEPSCAFRRLPDGELADWVRCRRQVRFRAYRAHQLHREGRRLARAIIAEASIHARKTCDTGGGIDMKRGRERDHAAGVMQAGFAVDQNGSDPISVSRFGTEDRRVRNWLYESLRSAIGQHGCALAVPQREQELKIMRHLFCR